MDNPSIVQLGQLSVEELANVEVTSASKQPEPLATAAAAIYVITADQIRRSGAVTLPEILRLAPNLEVIQISASRYTITARGFSGNIPDQSYSNKLLVLVDGRIVYTPMFSGVYWDMQDIPPEDIERIEVISGPRATLWGANAVNGVINIVTKPAADTGGGLVSLSMGNLEASGTIEYGGRLGQDLAYRLYLRDYIGFATDTANGNSAHDEWWRPQGGFRVDWTPTGADTVMVRGDTYGGVESGIGAPDEHISGSDLLVRWNHNFAGGSSLQVLAYYDRARRITEQNNGNFWVNTYDFEVQHNFDLNSWNAIVWGAGVRASDYKVNGTPNFFFAPDGDTLLFTDIFIQDNLTITPALSATLGLKLEDDAYAAAAPLVDARLSWQPRADMMFWAAYSTSIRSPTPFDVGVVEKAPGILLTGDHDFGSEKLTAYQVGTRMQPTGRLSFSVSAFYNVYDDVRSIQILADPTLFRLQWANGIRGHNYGVEAWGNYQLAPWWRLSAGVTELIQDFRFKASATPVLLEQLGDDPERTADLRSSMNLLPDVTFDADLRYVGHRPKPHVPSYVELNASLGWDATERLRLSLSGFNLLHAHHLEFPLPDAHEIPRSFAVGLQWRF